MVIAPPPRFLAIFFVTSLVRLLRAVQVLVTSFVILLPFLFVFQDVVRYINSLEFVLMHTTRTIWMILVALLVVHVLDFFRRRCLLQVKRLVVVLSGIESIWVGLLLTSPERPSLNLSHSKESSVAHEKSTIYCISREKKVCLSISLHFVLIKDLIF